MYGYEDELTYEGIAEFEASYGAWSEACFQERYERHVIEPCCDICNAVGRGSEQQLEQQGWWMRTGVYCPSH